MPSSDLSRYRWNLRILLVETPSRQNPIYLAAKKEYDTNMQKYHSHYTKLVTKIKKSLDAPIIKLIGFDGGVKKIYNELTTKLVMADIAAMPMGCY